MLVFATFAVDGDTELADRFVVGRPWRAALPASQLRGALTGADPLTVAAQHESALRRTDAAQTASRDRQATPGEHFAFDQTIAEDFVVIVAFFVAVKDAADGGIAPIDDLNTGARVEVGRSTDQ